MRLDKSESRERWRQARDLWLEFDPIGVMDCPDWPRDEYDAYLGPTLRLLEQRVSIDELQKYLAQVTLKHMGMSDSPQSEMKRRSFVKCLKDWYESRWPETHV